MKTRWFIATAACALGLAGLASVSSAASPDPAHSSRNALDWAGTYEGVTPCADCPGIRMRLTLGGDGRFVLATQYLGRQAAPQTVQGTFTWNTAGNTVTLEGAGEGRQFRVGEGRLLQLDRDGTAPPWDAPGRVLLRQPAATVASPATPPRRTADAALVRALQDHDWTLQAAVDAGGKPVEALLVPNQPFTMQFDGARVAVQGGCNRLFGTWRLSPQNALTVGRLASTQKACPPPLMAADTAMGAALSAPLQARLETGAAPVLHLASAKGPTLSFSGRRTLKSQYGEPVRVFLEVAAQRVPCTRTPQPPGTCLQVRELRFDDKGLRVGEPGPWRAFHDEIVGYTHEPGVGNVLRVNRFTRPRPPADASAYLYQLDLVVESRIEAKK